MATIKSFEDIEAWKKAISICSDIYAITNRNNFSNDFALKDQICRCAISVSSNIAEGFERESNNSFIYFLLIAKGSCGELRSQLLIAKMLKYIDNEEYEKLKQECETISRQISGLVSYLR